MKIYDKLNLTLLVHHDNITILLNLYRYQCNHGYSLQGVDQVYCNDGSLEPNPVTQPPQCRIISCPTRAAPQNGNAVLTPGGSPVHGSRYTFSCDSTYYRTGPGSITCNAGTWNPSGTAMCNPKPCNNFPCQHGGTCHNQGNYQFTCTCTANWQGNTCSSRKIIRSTLESEILTNLGQNGGTSNDNYRGVLFNYLSQRYPDYYWVVNAYNPVSGWDSHTIRGTYINYWRTHGRNLGVAWARKSSTGLPSNMASTKSMFESRVRHQGCDPRTVTQKAFDIGTELGLPTRMAHVVRFGNGLRSEYHTAFTFFLNYDCTSNGDQSSLVVSFGQG